MVLMPAITITSDNSTGLGELYTDWYGCPRCGYDDVAGGSSYCPNCGAEIVWKLEDKDD